jgi:alkylation response protein AidB-like acyl-CoA dehydrogenase
MLHDAAAGFAKFDGPRLRGLRAVPGSIDRKMWRALAEQGWFSVLVPEADGGLDLGIAASAVIAEQLGHGCLPEPFVAAGVMTPLLVGRSSNTALKAKVLPKMLAGEIVATLAWQGETGSLSIDDVHVTASESNREATLNGSCRFVPASGADAFIVLTRRPDGPALYWVDRNSPGLQITNEPLADGSASGWLRFGKVHIPSADALAGPAHAGVLVAAAVDFGLIVQSAELVGNMERALEMTLDYMRTRKQFGQAIGSFQSLQHRAVDIWMAKELARHTVTSAAAVASDPAASPAVRGAAASSAKNRAAESAMLIAKQTIQLHGAIGTTDEYDLGLYVNRMVASVPWLGNAAAHRQRYGQLAPARERVSATA